jgi:hypothetical protein
MFKLKPFTMDELRARAARSTGPPSTATQAMAERPQPRPNNVRAILDLGTLVYFQWRGRSFGVPPLPWKAGAELLDAWLEARGYGETLTDATAPGYYAALNRMSRIMWRHTRLVGYAARMLRRVGLIRNPYRLATEAELADLVLFFLGRRMKTNGIRTVTPAPLHRGQTT